MLLLLYLPNERLQRRWNQTGKGHSLHPQFLGRYWGGKDYSHSEGSQTLGQAAQKGYGFSILEYMQTSVEYDSRKHDLT